MSQRLFSVPKIGLFLDSFAPGTEKRRGDRPKILTLTLRLQPFDAKLAAAIDDGLGGDSGVRAALFKLNTPDPKPRLERVNLSLGCPRQTLRIFSSPDTKTSRIALAQCRISGTYARTQKDIAGYAFVFQAMYGPLGAAELEFIQHWYLGQQFVTFEESEPGVIDEVEEEAPLHPGGQAPMWDDGAETAAADAGETDAARPTPKRGSAKKAKTTPEAERAQQVSDGKRRPH